MAGAAAPATAAEWALTPIASLGGDNDSNRYLQAQSAYSQSASIAAGLDVQRTTETTQVSLSPHINWQYIFPHTYGEVFERDVTAAGSWTRERSSFDFTAQDADRSTLSTEATQTGILSTRLHQRSDQASLASTFTRSERRALKLQLSYSDISYYGVPDAAVLNLLSGYRLATGSLGETFSFSERATLTGSFFSSEVLSRMPGDNINQTGAQLDYSLALSERAHIDVSGGAARLHSAVGGETLPVASLQFSRSWERSNLEFSYSRALVPYGTGVLVQRQTWSLSGTHNLSTTVSVTAALSRVQNSQPPTQPHAVLQLALVQAYNNATLGTDWRFAETWTASAQVGTTQTRTAAAVSQPVHEWRVGLSLTWKPHPLTRSGWP